MEHYISLFVRSVFIENMALAFFVFGTQIAVPRIWFIYKFPCLAVILKWTKNKEPKKILKKK